MLLIPWLLPFSFGAAWLVRGDRSGFMHAAKAFFLNFSGDLNEVAFLKTVEEKFSFEIIFSSECESHTRERRGAAGAYITTPKPDAELQPTGSQVDISLLDVLSPGSRERIPKTHSSHIQRKKNFDIGMRINEYDMGSVPGSGAFSLICQVLRGKRIV
ncbi:hypothetical protein F2P81_024984 [Scophthalmus maximus]|uniref:Protein kinase domain-containing protein n=1 Tax=Scophthalmus maximus TaxID=52904 RepID=A0A6A4RMC0_SCOMX|nr:hypothetical protein F2P81_024984 [Scophthalmus maximus]